MAQPFLFFHLAFALCFLLIRCLLLADAAVVEHTFHVGNLTVERLGQSQVITAVNGQFPGPKIEARDGDTVVVHVVNLSPYNISIHWHGILQRLSSWADGPNMVSQCPIRPAGGRYTYRFNVTGQEGTLWWHAHVSFLRATVYGALLLRPAPGASYPFPTPHHEATILLGEWWNASVVDVERQALLAGGAPNNSVALTINGRTTGGGGGYQLLAGRTYLLRIINAALNYQLFFKVAAHSFTVVAADACYTDPYHTDVIVLAPGQTVDALMRADAHPAGRYYMAAQVYQSLASATYSAPTTALVTYHHQRRRRQPPRPTPPPVTIMMPSMPAFNDSATAQGFYASLTGLLPDGTPTVPLHVDTRMLVTFGLGVTPCAPAQTLCNLTLGSVAASMNNVSFQFPTAMSLLEARMRGAPEGVVYTRDFPDRPPVMFDFTSEAAAADRAVMATSKGTKVKALLYGETVEVVLQNTAILGAENHPLHLHGFNFYVLAQGAGNFNAHRHVRTYNLVNPHQRNTVAVPAGGWAAIRFTADNPGMWIMHCHLDAHLPFGLAMVFEVDDGPTPDAVLPPPPPDYPQC